MEVLVACIDTPLYSDPELSSKELDAGRHRRRSCGLACEQRERLCIAWQGSEARCGGAMGLCRERGWQLWAVAVRAREEGDGCDRSAVAVALTSPTVEFQLSQEVLPKMAEARPKYPT